MARCALLQLILAVPLHSLYTEVSDNPAPIARPSAGGGAESIHADVMCKTLYGVDMKGGSFVADMVTALSWTDARAAAIIPNNTTSITLPLERAKAQIWVPDYAFTNRDISGQETISVAVKVTRESVSLVDRSLVRFRNKFDVRMFPFDAQVLTARLSSTSLMADSLKFDVEAVTNGSEDPKGFSGTRRGILAGKDLELSKWTIKEFLDVTGALEKSRVEFQLHVKRNFLAYVPSVLLPHSILMAVSLTVYSLPLLPPFAMPRVATSLITCLAMMSAMATMNAMVPARASLAWMDIYQQGGLMFVVANALLNVAIEAVGSTLKQKPAAEQMNAELRSLMPIIGIAFLVICFLLTHEDNLEWLSFFSKACIIVPLAVWIVVVTSRIRRLPPSSG